MTAQSLFELLCAIAITTGPSLGAVLVPAVAPRMRVLDPKKLEVFLPIRPFFRQRRITKTGFDPCCNAVGVQARFVHIINVLVPGDGTLAKRTVTDRAQQGLRFARFYFCFDEIAHERM